VTDLPPSLTFGDAIIAFPTWGTLITWSDGTFVSGAPENTDAYRKTAFDHGYGDDTLALCREHELLHLALCHWLGIPSPVMEAMRNAPAEMPGAEIRALEETAVLAVQRFARAMAVDLMDQMAKGQPIPSGVRRSSHDYWLRINRIKNSSGRTS